MFARSGVPVRTVGAAFARHASCAFVAPRCFRAFKPQQRMASEADRVRRERQREDGVDQRHVHAHLGDRPRHDGQTQLLRVPIAGTSPQKYYDLEVRSSGGVFDNFASTSPAG